METLKERLFDIALDQGETDPSNRFFEKILGVSSGRVTQLLEYGSMTKLGTKSLSKLVAMGYNPDWVQMGPPHRKWLLTQEQLKPASVHHHKRKLVRRMCDLSEKISDLGLMYLIGKAEELEKTHPHAPKQAKAA